MATSPVDRDDDDRLPRLNVEVGDGKSSSALRVPIGPFGETLTWPSAASGGSDEEHRPAGDPPTQVIVYALEDLQPLSARSSRS